MRAICYIPSIDCLIYRPAEYWLGQFVQRSGMPVTDVVFPAIVGAEPAYPSRYGQTAARLGQFNWLGQWVQDARNQHPGLRVWAAVDPTISSLSNQLISIRDQWDEPMEGACINHSVVQQMLTQVINELADITIDGIVFDLTDLYPNSTTLIYPKLQQGERLVQSSCFCPHCVNAFSSISGYQLDPESFRGERNIARLILHPSENGASFIELRESWMKSLDVDRLVHYSVARGFINRDDPYREIDGQHLLRYANARSTVTANAIMRLRHVVQQRGLRTAVILGTAQFDITCGTTMAALVECDASDEYWSSDAETSVNIREHPLVIFAERRATYVYNALFANLRTLEDPRQYMDEERRVSHIINVSGAAIEHSSFSSSSCAVLQLIPDIAGIAGIPYTMQDFIEWIRQRHTDRQFPQRRMTLILSHVRNAAPSTEQRRDTAAGRDPFA